MPVERDLAFVVPLNVHAADIVKAALTVERGLIAGVQVFDVYEGQGVPSGHKSVAIAVTLQPLERTLKDEEIEAVMTRVVAEVARKTGAALRG
jgi:phenylalanyl-tRNA synthetase beta chain